MVYQRAVVVKAALRNIDLGFRCLRLLLCLAQAGHIFGAVHTRHDLSGFDEIAFAHLQVLQLTRHTRFDEG